MRRIGGNEKGFSLVELVIYMSLVMILLTVLAQIFLSSLDVQLSSQSASSVQQEGRYLLARLTYDVHRASAVTSPTGMGASSSTLGLTIAGSPYTYTVNNGALSLTVDGNSAVALNEFDTVISAFSVQEAGNTGGKPTLTINFTISGTNSGSSQVQETRQYQTTVDLR